VSNQLTLELLESANNALEGSSNVREVGNATTNNKNFALGIWGTSGDKIDLQTTFQF